LEDAGLLLERVHGNVALLLVVRSLGLITLGALPVVREGDHGQEQHDAETLTEWVE
jgi:hypothetical protein